MDQVNYYIQILSILKETKHLMHFYYKRTGAKMHVVLTRIFVFLFTVQSVLSSDSCSFASSFRKQFKFRCLFVGIKQKNLELGERFQRLYQIFSLLLNIPGNACLSAERAEVSMHLIYVFCILFLCLKINMKSGGKSFFVLLFICVV